MADDFLNGFNEILGQPAKFNSAVTVGFDQFKVMLEAAAKDATTMKIVTKAGLLLLLTTTTTFVVLLVVVNKLIRHMPLFAASAG
jgi:hypothetical protein